MRGEVQQPMVALTVEVLWAMCEIVAARLEPAVKNIDVVEAAA